MNKLGGWVLGLMCASLASALMVEATLDKTEVLAIWFGVVSFMTFAGAFTIGVAWLIGKSDEG